MKFLNKLQHWAALLCVISMSVAPVPARTKKGDKLFKLAVQAEDAKNYDQALDYYDQALSTDPKDPSYLLAEQRIRPRVAEAHIREGRLLQGQQKLDQALVEFQRALLADPASQIAIQEVHQTNAMVEQRAKTPGIAILTPAEVARQSIEKRINALEGPPSLRPINDQISSLKMNSQPVRVLYESVSKLAGINVLFDPQGIEAVAGKNFNLDLNNVTLQEALNYIALETHTFWKPISHNAIFVTQESEPKRQEYQDEVVKVFYVQNATTQAEFTEIFNAVRTGAKLNTGIFQVASQNAIIARGPTDTISLVEKLVHDLDHPKPEVMVDVVVMEVNKIKSRTLGAALLGQGGLSLPGNFTPRGSITVPNTTSTTSTTGTTATTTTTGTTGTTTTGTTGTTTSTSIPISQLGHLSSADFSTTLPSALLQALMSDNTSRILQRPQIRAIDGGKASLKIGQKIPYVSGSLNSAIATPGSVPYATTQFQQVDVGVNIDLEPHVNGPEDVSMHIKVEISNTAAPITIAGISEPVITQRVNEAQIRMKDGQPAILGGLSDVEDTNTNNGVPGITNIPVLGYLFGTKTKSNSDDQILVALIPHIVRAPDLSALGNPGVLAGTERVVRVERKPDGTLTVTPLSPTDGTRPPGNGSSPPPNATPPPPVALPPAQVNPPPNQPKPSQR